MKKTLIIFVLFFAFELNAKDYTNYSCIFKDIPQPTELVYPVSIQLTIDFDEKIIKKYIEDEKNLTARYQCYECVSDKKRVAVRKRNFERTDEPNREYDPWGWENIEEARVFEIYSSDLVGHLWKPFVPGVNYQCVKY